MCYQAKLWLSLAVFLISHGATAGTVVMPDTDPASGIRMELESWLEHTPQAGMLPVEWRVVNNSASPETWELTTNSNRSYMGQGTIEGRYAMSVAAQSSGSMMIYIPIMPTSHSYGYQSVEWRISGVGMRRGGAFPNIGVSSSGTEYIAIGKEAAGNAGWKSLENEVNKASSTTRKASSTSLFGCEVDMKKAPADWRGYSGLAQLWVSDREWLGMLEMSRQAVLDWVSMGGGKLFILTQDTGARELAGLKLAEGDKSRAIHGAGMVTRMQWDGSELPVGKMKEIVNRSGDDLKTALENYGSGWNMYKKIGLLKINAPLIFCFILVFGILVGPVNLFVFAGPGKRSRLFWTTPLISIGGSLLLMVLMVVQDGFGGRGIRQVLAVLQPDQKRLSVIQEQVSLTGILSNRAFERKEQDLMLPLLIDQKGSMTTSLYQESASERSGAWFTSRAIQSHVSQAVRPSRAGVEFYPAKEADGAAEVISTLEVPLQTLYVRDDEGVIWKADSLETGERKALTRVDGKSLTDWVANEVRDQSGPLINQALDSALAQKGYVFAISTTAAPLAISSLDSIHWNEDKLIVVGPYVTP